MKLGEAITKTSQMVHEAAIALNVGKIDEAVDMMVDLRELLEEPIDPDNPEETDTKPTHCSKCNQVID